MITLEWAEKTGDILFEEVLDLTPESAQKATAWTGLFLAIGLSGWGGYKLRQKYLRAKVAAPDWWKDKKTQMKTWWAALTWTQKLGQIVGWMVLLSLMILLI